MAPVYLPTDLTNVRKEESSSTLKRGFERPFQWMATHSLRVTVELGGVLLGEKLISAMSQRLIPEPWLQSVPPKLQRAVSVGLAAYATLKVLDAIDNYRNPPKPIVEERQEPIIAPVPQRVVFKLSEDA